MMVQRTLLFIFIFIAIAACSKTSPKHEDRHDPAEAAPALQLNVTVDGSASAWKQDVFDRVPHFASTNNDGEARDTWSLRELAHAGAGPTARITAVVGDVTKPIDAAAWNDPSRTPVVHRTRRGGLKFRWAGKDGTWGETEVKDVNALELVSH